MPVVICRCLQKYVSMYLCLIMQIILIQMHIWLQKNPLSAMPTEDPVINQIKLSPYEI